MKRAEDWIRFLRKYGPIARNGNMFDEDIMRTSIRTGIAPITFEHPLTDRLISCLDPSSDSLKSVILTGAAGDGETSVITAQVPMIKAEELEIIVGLLK